MLLPLNRLRRTVAALLPVALLWVFAACVSACGGEVEAADGQAEFAAVGAAAVGEAAECEGCPDASLFRATAPERATFKPDLRTASSAPTLPPPAATSAGAGAVATPRRRRFPPDPPPRLPPTLRI